MSKPTRRAYREQIKARKKQYKQVQKLLRQDEKANRLWDEQCLQRTIKKQDKSQSQYHVGVLEANPAFSDA
jgi:hypothetical protein